MAGRQHLQTKAREDIARRFENYAEDHEVESETQAVEQLLDDGLRANGYENGHGDDVPLGARVAQKAGEVALYVAAAFYVMTLFPNGGSPQLYGIAAAAMVFGLTATLAGLVWRGTGVSVLGKTFFEREKA